MRFLNYFWLVSAVLLLSTSSRCQVDYALSGEPPNLIVEEQDDFEQHLLKGTTWGFGGAYSKDGKWTELQLNMAYSVHSNPKKTLSYAEKEIYICFGDSVTVKPSTDPNHVPDVRAEDILFLYDDGQVITYEPWYEGVKYPFTGIYWNWSGVAGGHWFKVESEPGDWMTKSHPFQRFIGDRIFYEAPKAVRIYHGEGEVGKLVRTGDYTDFEIDKVWWNQTIEILNK